MPQIRTRSLCFAVLCSLLALALSGCGDVNSKATFDSDSGQHAADWLPAGHKSAAQADLPGCIACHGEDLSGGIAKVSCLTCHIGGATSAHPVLWNGLAYALHAGYVEVNGNASCATALCHGTDLLGVTDSGPSCAVNCHMAGSAEAPRVHAWVAADTGEQIAGHKAYFEENGVDYSSCRNAACHGSNLTGAWLSGPSCSGTGCHGSGNPLPDE